MSINPDLPDAEDPHVAAAIARAERRRGKLERMSDVGMELVEQVGAQAAAVNETREGDPCRAFAVVSRAVRMTLALEARVDDRILALRRGEFPAARRARAPAATEAVEAETANPVVRPPDPRRTRAGKAVREAIHLEIENITDARERLDALNERLFDRESYDVLLNLPLRDTVAAICADLGIEPDWSLWTEDTGFVAPTGRRCIDWTALCARSPAPQGTRAKPPAVHRRQ